MKTLSMMEEVDGLFTLSISGVPAADIDRWYELNRRFVVATEPKPETLEEAIVRMAKSGKSMIDCIKHVRTVTGNGLKEAKDFCESLKQEHGLWENKLKSLENLIVDMARDGRLRTKIDGIKEVRNSAAWGDFDLRAAKDLCDRLAIQHGLWNAR